MNSLRRIQHLSRVSRPAYRAPGWKGTGSSPADCNGKTKKRYQPTPAANHKSSRVPGFYETGCHAGQFLWRAALGGQPSPGTIWYNALMDRATITEHLAQTERHVAQGDHHVARQRELVTELEDGGHDAALARRLLMKFEELQSLHIADRDRLRRELAELG